MAASETERTIRAVFRLESAKLIAGLTRLVRDVELAADLAQDALVTALEKWPESGVPNNPGAWLMATAKNSGLNSLRNEKLRARKHEQLGREVDATSESVVQDLEEALDDDIGDDLLRLMFTACHPSLSTEARVALTLRLLGGLATDEIARAFLVPEPTIAQRIVRAKRMLTEQGVAFEVPRGNDLAPRLASVFEVVYLIFNEGYVATAGGDVMRPALCEDALRLGRVLAGLVPQEAEAHALVALMELNASRAAARVSPSGEPIRLSDQNRGFWDHTQIARGLSALARAEADAGRPRGAYTLQAAIAACHARARTAAETDWSRIAALYAELVIITPSPIVELNRAIAVSMADGPQAALAIVDRLRDEPLLRTYHLLPAARAEFLVKLGRMEEARAEFERAASLTRNTRQRDRLLKRAAECGAPGGARSPFFS